MSDDKAVLRESDHRANLASLSVTMACLDYKIIQHHHPAKGNLGHVHVHMRSRSDRGASYHSAAKHGKLDVVEYARFCIGLRGITAYLQGIAGFLLDCRSTLLARSPWLTPAYLYTAPALPSSTAIYSPPFLRLSCTREVDILCFVPST